MHGVHGTHGTCGVHGAHRKRGCMGRMGRMGCMGRMENMSAHGAVACRGAFRHSLDCIRVLQFNVSLANIKQALHLHPPLCTTQRYTCVYGCP